MPDPISATIGAVGSIGGSLLGAEGNRKAASQQAGAANNAAELQRLQFEQSREDYSPYRTMGNAAISPYMSAILGSGYKYTDGDGKEQTTGAYNPMSSPSYSYLSQQGTKAMNRNLASRGLLGSGQAATGLTDMNNQLLADDYWKRIAAMGNLVEAGRGSTQNLAALGANSAQAQGNNLMAAGNAQAAGSQARGSLYGNMVSNLGAMPIQMMGMQSQINAMNRLGQPQFVAPYATGTGNW